MNYGFLEKVKIQSGMTLDCTMKNIVENGKLLVGMQRYYLNTELGKDMIIIKMLVQQYYL